MKLLLAVSILLSANLGFSKVFKAVEHNEAYANIMGLFVEDSNKDLEIADMKVERNIKLKLMNTLAKREIRKTDVRESRLFLNLDFDQMCNTLKAKKEYNHELVASDSKYTKKVMNGKVYRKWNHNANRTIFNIASRNNRLIEFVQEKYCIN